MVWTKAHQIDFVDSSSCGEIYRYWIDTWLPQLGFTVAGESTFPLGTNCSAYGTLGDAEFGRHVSWTNQALLSGQPQTYRWRVYWYSDTNSYIRWGIPQNMECTNPEGGRNNGNGGFGICGVRTDWDFRWDFHSPVWYFKDSSRYADGQDVRFWVSDQNSGAGLITQGRRIKWYWPGFTELTDWEHETTPMWYARHLMPMGENYWYVQGYPFHPGNYYGDEDHCGDHTWDDYSHYQGRITPHFHTGQKRNLIGGGNPDKSWLLKNVQLWKSADYQYNRMGWENAYWGTLPDDVLIYCPYQANNTNGFHWNSVSVPMQLVSDGTNYYISTYDLNDTTSALWFDFGTSDPSAEFPLLDQ